MNRILFCIYTHNAWGGIEFWLDSLSVYLAGKGWDVRVGLARGRRFNDPEPIRRSHPQYRVAEIDGRTGTREGRIRAVCRAVRRVKPDLVVPLGLADVRSAVGRLKRSGVPVRLVEAIHSTNPEMFNEIRAFAPIIDLCAGVNPLHASFLSGWADLPAERLTSILCGVWQPTARHVRDGRPDRPLRLAFVGRFHQHHKRVLDTVPLVAELKRRGVPFCLSFVGSGEAEVELRRRLRDEEAEGTVRFLGFLSREGVHSQVYPSHDVLVLFSPSEGCPLSVQEAMGHGVIPVCSEFLGVHSLGFLRHGETALIYALGDLSRMADHLERLSREPALLQRLSLSCVTEAKGMTIEHSHLLWEKAFRKALALPVRGLGKDVDCPGSKPIRSANRLDRLCGSPGLADWIRRTLRRWPNFRDGWAEWPGTVVPTDAAMHADMIQELSRLDRLAEYSGEPEPAFP
jgi:glycosyltransferase involved in cell wall biosynthesis